MRKIDKNYLRQIVSSLFCAVFFCAGYVSAFAQTTANIDALVEKQIAGKRIPGASVAVIRDGKVLTVKGYGFENLETKVPATENTVYEIASVTKQFTAAGILLLVEEGKIKLDESIGKYLDNLPEAWRVVTVRQLLIQTSGIKNYTTVAAMEQEKDYSVAEMIKFVADAPMEFAPGTSWQYSNTNYFLLGLITERISGKSYAEFMRQRIFEPLGMSATQINDRKATIKNRAVGYERDKGDFKIALRVSPTQPYAAGAIVSTVADMAKWDAALSNENLLKRASLEQMFAPAGKIADDNPAKYSFGWFVTRIGAADAVLHGGNIAGFNSFIVRFPNEKLSVVVFANVEGKSAEDIGFDIAGLYIPAVAQMVAERSKPAEKIEDADVATTKFLRETLEKFAAGEDIQNRFTTEAQAALFPDKAKQLQAALSKFGAIKSMELVGDETLPQGKRRMYRVAFATVLVRFTFVVTADGKIGGIHLRPE